MPRLAIILALVLLPTAVACSDPVKARLLDDLGDENPGVPAGPLHRPGQPCVLCHGGDGPAESVFSFGGTIYQDRTTATPLADGIVRIIDSAKKTYETGTNCAGNFFIMKADYNPTFPVWAEVVFAGQPVQMTSAVYREGSCATCHSDKPGTASAGRVYLAPQPITLPQSCP